MSQLKKAFKRGMVIGLKDVTFEKDKLCSACQAGKQVASHHPMLSHKRSLEIKIKGEPLPQHYQVPPWHLKWMKRRRKNKKWKMNHCQNNKNKVNKPKMNKFLHHHKLQGSHL